MSQRYEFPRFKAAAVQAGPVVRDAPEYFDTEATLDKALSLISEAGRNGARLIVFPEGWMPCFSYWSLDLNDQGAFKDIWAKYLWSSVVVPGPETEALCAAAKSVGAYVVMGINESDGKFQGRMYNSILYISPHGEIMGTHRKICNTVQERLFHTPGDGGDNLKAVFKTEIGNIGGSICGEHNQLPLIYNWMMQGIQVHCSLWPGHAGLETRTDIKTRSLCSTARVYGVLAAAYMPEKDKPKNFYRNSFFSIPGSFRGGSGIINPYGEYVAGPVYDQETIVYGDIDLADIDRSRYSSNLLGLYSRWDLLNINVRQKSYQPIVPMAETETASVESERIKDLEVQVKQLQQQIAALAETDKKKRGKA
ncbi:carbon-nitrogen hydrolase family protein [Chloroflexota bacterium]